MNKTNYKELVKKQKLNEAKFITDFEEKYKITYSEYRKVHSWVNKTFGRASKCENPKCELVSERYEWSLLKGKKYDYKKQNFWQLCKICHVRYDGKKSNNYKGVLYRITPAQDFKVKKLSKKLNLSESAYIRLLIEGGHIK